MSTNYQISLPPNDYIYAEDVELYVKPTEQYDPLPILDGVPKEHALMSKEDIEEYFQCLINGEIMVRVVNGYELQPYLPTWCCDYCAKLLGSSESENYICSQCLDFICHECSTKKGKAIDTSTGNNVQTLQECFDSHSVKIIREYRCDMCMKDICDCRQFTNVTEAGQDSLDLCLKCSETDQGQDLIAKENLKNIETETFSHAVLASTFGSMLEWVPYLRDSEKNMILVNCDPHSIWNGKIALSACDYRERRGYYVVNEDLESICLQLDTLQTESEERYPEASRILNEEHQVPIKQIMYNHNFRTQYGLFSN